MPKTKDKYFFAQVKRINEAERTIDAVASTIDLDRDKDIILPGAFTKTLGSFKANPVILACHQHRLSSGSSPVIGSATPDSIKVDDRKVTFTMSFATTKLGEEYWQLYRDKHMRAFSIGFIPLEYEDKKDEKLGYIRIYTKIELLEISAVPVPSNRRALARAKGYFDSDDDEGSADFDSDTIKTIQHTITSEIKTQLDDFSISLEDSFDEIKTLLIADSDGLARELLGARDDTSNLAGDKESEQLSAVAESLKELTDKL